MTNPVMPPTGYRDAINSFRVIAKNGEAVEFKLHAGDYGTSYAAGRPGRYGWCGAGIDKLMAHGFWKREFTRGSYGSADAVLKTEPPTVESMMELGMAQAARSAEPPAPPPASSVPSLVPTGAAPAAPAAKAAPASETFSPDELAAEINRKFGRR